MKKTGFFLLIAVAFGVFTCDKEHDTVINGVVTDAKTGEVIAGATLDCSISESGGGVTNAFIIHTDNEGRFHFSYKKNEFISGFSLSHDGYLRRFNFFGEGVEYTKGTTNDINLVLHPLDGTLKMSFHNEGFTFIKLFAQVQTKTLRTFYGQLPFVITDPYPVELSPNSITEQYYPITSEEMAYFYWDYVNFDPQKPESAAFFDSLYLVKGDTSVFEIHL